MADISLEDSEFSDDIDIVNNNSIIPATAVTTPTPAKRAMNRRSAVWREYDIVDLKQEGVQPRAFCKHCKDHSFICITRFGTTNMKDHLKKCSAYLNKSNQEHPSFDQMHYRELVAKAVIRHGYAFSWVEHEGNRDIHAYLNNQVQTICRNTVKADCLKLHAKLKAELKQTLSDVPGRICLTSDMWTSCQTLGYMVLTAHYVDSSWKLNSKVLNFVHLETGHTGHAMYSEVLKLLREWGIENKIFSITLDNASSNDKMQDHLKKALNHGSSLVKEGVYFHIRCAAHVLNLIVKDGLSIIEHCVTKIRESVKYVSWSESRKRAFNISVKNANINETKGLWLDVPTRWNSTYFMLDRALLYRAAFIDMGSSSSGYKHVPTEEEWNMVEQLRDVLEPFSDINDLFSGREYPTANLYFENVWRIAMLLNELVKSDDWNLSDMARSMKEKFDKYWFSSDGQDYNTLFAFALVLDPRRKKQVLKHCFDSLYDDGKTTILKYTDVIYKLEKLYEEYDQPEKNTSLESPASRNQPRAETSSNRKRKFGFAEIILEKSTYNVFRRSQLDMYFEDPILDEDQSTPFNVLEFWKENEMKYGKLSHLARDILTVPLTTVASESTFSIGGRVLNKWRWSILPKNVEALITSRSWLYAYDGDEEENIGSEVDWNKYG